MKKITAKLDIIAGSLETKGLLKEAEALDLISNTIEAVELRKGLQDIKSRAKALLSKIPGAKMMSPNEAQAVLDNARQRDPRGTSSLIAEVMRNLQGLAATNPITGLEANEVEASWGSFMRGLTNPRVLIAVLSLMATTGSALGATPAGSPADTTKQEQVQQKSSLRFDVQSSFRSAIEKINKDGTGKNKTMNYNTIISIPGTNEEHTLDQKNENEYQMVIEFNRSNEKLRQAVVNGLMSEEDHGKAVKDMIASYERITAYAHQTRLERLSDTIDFHSQIWST